MRHLNSPVFGGMQWFPTTIVCDIGHLWPAPFDLEFQGLFEVVLMSGRITQATVRALDWIAQKLFLRIALPLTSRPDDGVKKRLTFT